MLWKGQSKESTVFLIILRQFLVIFSTTTSISFTKLKIRRSFWVAKQVLIIIGSKVMTQQSNQFSYLVFLLLWSDIAQKISEKNPSSTFNVSEKKLSKITGWVWLAKGKDDKNGWLVKHKHDLWGHFQNCPSHLPFTITQTSKVVVD